MALPGDWAAAEGGTVVAKGRSSPGGERQGSSCPLPTLEALTGQPSGQPAMQMPACAAQNPVSARSLDAPLSVLWRLLCGLGFPWGTLTTRESRVCWGGGWGCSFLVLSPLEA